MITPANFKCDRKCADCCRYLTVKVTKKEIEKIKKEGYDEFFEYDDHIRSNVLRLTDKGCIFLGKKGDRYYCKIYRIRPKVCRKYPFVKSDRIESCKPALLKYRNIYKYETQ